MGTPSPTPHPTGAPIEALFPCIYALLDAPNGWSALDEARDVLISNAVTTVETAVLLSESQWARLGLPVGVEVYLKAEVKNAFSDTTGDVVLPDCALEQGQQTLEPTPVPTPPCEDRKVCRKVTKKAQCKRQDVQTKCPA